MVFRIGCKFFKKKTKKRHSEQILTSIISAVNNKPPKDEIEKFKKFKNKYIMMAKGDSGFAKTANAASGNGTNGDQDGMPIVLASGSFNPTSSAAGMQHNCSILLRMEDNNNNNNTTDKERKAIRTLPPGTYS